MSIVDRARPDLADFRPYASARRIGSAPRIRLDANESPWPVDAATPLNRYPEPQPAALRARLAALYGVGETQLWIGRGSDEAIDLLMRAFCRAGRDNVVSHTPTFGMYRIGAQLQGASCRELALDPAADFSLDIDKLLALTDADTKLVIVCSPNNPTGTCYHANALADLANALHDRALLLIDEAYLEFSGAASASALIARHDNVAILRTLSKAHALAGARVGSLIADADVIELVARIAAPYPLPAPSVCAALDALDDDTLARTVSRVAVICEERERVARALRDLPDV
ncbi:MAG: aminotransferase class I/II-fold pyridoxal phosphate-dependent enzyme, partial [Dokdonella sp.]